MGKNVDLARRLKGTYLAINRKIGAGVQRKVAAEEND
jgi:hypothetical protein